MASPTVSNSHCMATLKLVSSCLQAFHHTLGERYLSIPRKIFIRLKFRASNHGYEVFIFFKQHLKHLPVGWKFGVRFGLGPNPIRSKQNLDYNFPIRIQIN